MDVIRTGDILVVTALERLGRDTLGLLELINRAGHHGRGAEGAGYAGDALDVAGGGALVAAGVAAIKRANISRRTKQGLDRVKAEALAKSLIAANWPECHFRFSIKGAESLDNNTITARPWASNTSCCGCAGPTREAHSTRR